VKNRFISRELTFREGFDAWIKNRTIPQDVEGWRRSRVKFISDRTIRDLYQYARAAGRFFDELVLGEIHAGHFREYQKARARNKMIVAVPGAGSQVIEPWARPAGANLILKEVQTVIRVMRAADAWTEALEASLELIDRDDSDVERALSPEEQLRWLTIAGSREAWRLVYWYSIVALQTTAATNEMRSLRLGDIFLGQSTMQIRSEGAKNKYRIRTIPLHTPEVRWALGGLIARAQRLGANGPDCYLFPFHITGDRYDLRRPMSPWGLKKPWAAVREASGVEITPYGLRHCAITRMAEAGTPIQVIMSFAGHIRREMQEHYTMISMQSKRRWAAAAWANADMPYLGQGYPTAPTTRPTVQGWQGEPLQEQQPAPGQTIDALALDNLAGRIRRRRG
jgi:integrase